MIHFICYFILWSFFQKLLFLLDIASLAIMSYVSTSLSLSGCAVVRVRVRVCVLVLVVGGPDCLGVLDAFARIGTYNCRLR